MKLIRLTRGSRRIVAVLVMVAGILGGATGARPSAMAQGAPPFSAGVLRPDLSSWDFIVGRWTCAFKGGGASSFSQTSELVYDGAWLHTRSEIPLGKGNATPGTLIVSAYATQDPRAHTWFYTGIDSGGGHTVGTSSGWNGNVFVWSLRDVTTGRVMFTTTITKAGNREFTTVTGLASAGMARSSFASTCRKI